MKLSMPPSDSWKKNSLVLCESEGTEVKGDFIFLALRGGRKGKGVRKIFAVPAGGIKKVI